MASLENCAADEQVCVPEQGCLVCTPGARRCADSAVLRCLPDGSDWREEEVCDGATGWFCDPAGGSCVSPCDQASNVKSYEGCEFFAIAAPNPELDVSSFEFAVVLSNASTYTAAVEVRDGQRLRNTLTIAPGDVEVVPLPSSPSHEGHSLLYEVSSTAPLVAYQFNPLEYARPAGCDARDGACRYSYTNDASLLLPTHALTGNYLVSTIATQTSRRSDGESHNEVDYHGYAVVAAVDDADVTLQLRSDSLVTKLESGEIFSAFQDEEFNLSLRRGEMAVIRANPGGCQASSPEEHHEGIAYTFCEPERPADLSGSLIRASGRLAVLAGHECAHIPFNRRRCDHLEEMLPPEDTLGTSALVAMPATLRDEPTLVRVISAEDENHVEVSLPEVGSSVLHRGEVLEFQTDRNVAVNGSGALLVAHYTVGHWYHGLGSAPEDAPGDPSMSFVSPIAQFLNSYTLFVPDTFSESYLSIVAPDGASVELDGALLEESESESESELSSGFRTWQVPVEGGVRRISGDRPIGVSVYGYASHTSYFYPGGLDLRMINLI